EWTMLARQELLIGIGGMTPDRRLSLTEQPLELEIAPAGLVAKAVRNGRSALAIPSSAASRQCRKPAAQHPLQQVLMAVPFEAADDVFTPGAVCHWREDGPKWRWTCSKFNAGCRNDANGALQLMLITLQKFEQSAPRT